MEEIEAFWEVLLQIDSTLSITDNTKKCIEDKPVIKSYTDHCWKATHYSFQVKKCGKPECKLCQPASKFESIKFLPDQTLYLMWMGITKHFLKFMAVQLLKNTDHL